MITALTTPQTEALLGNHYRILRSYTLVVHIVPNVDNQGEQCPYCDFGRISTTVYGREVNGDDTAIDCCQSCAVRLIDAELDLDTAYAVVIETIQGA